MAALFTVTFTATNPAGEVYPGQELDIFANDADQASRAVATVLAPAGFRWDVTDVGPVAPGKDLYVLGALDA